MKHKYLPLLAAATTLGLAACSNDNSTPVGTGYFRALNGVTDSSSMNVDLGNVGTASAIAYADASGVTTIPEGSYDATVKPTGDSSQDYKVTGVPINHDQVSTVLTYGSVSAGTKSGFKATESISAPTTANTFSVQFIDDAYTDSQLSPSLNFYIIPTGSTISDVTPVSVQFGSASARTDFQISSDGNYELVIKGTSGVTIYDSGTSAQLLQNGANVLQIAAVDAPSGSSAVSPLAVVVMDNKGGHFQVAPATASN